MAARGAKHPRRDGTGQPTPTPWGGEIMRIALDARGGDNAPGRIVTGAVQAVGANPDLQVVLVGDRAQVEACLPQSAAGDRLEVFHASQVITMEDSPVQGLRKKPDSSISRCWQLLAER